MNEVLIIIGILGGLLLIPNFDDLTFSSMRSYWGARLLGGMFAVKAYLIYADPMGNTYYFVGCIILFFVMVYHENKLYKSFQEFFAFENEEYKRQMSNDEQIT